MLFNLFVETLKTIEAQEKAKLSAQVSRLALKVAKKESQLQKRLGVQHESIKSRQLIEMSKIQEEELKRLNAQLVSKTQAVRHKSVVAKSNVIAANNTESALVKAEFLQLKSQQCVDNEKLREANRKKIHSIRAVLATSPERRQQMIAQNFDATMTTCSGLFTEMSYLELQERLHMSKTDKLKETEHKRVMGIAQKVAKAKQIMEIEQRSKAVNLSAKKSAKLEVVTTTPRSPSLSTKQVDSLRARLEWLKQHQ